MARSHSRPVNMIPPVQVADDPALLARLVADEAAADPLYQATPYWVDANRRLVAELQQIGLKDFRRRRQGSVLNDFGATDLAFAAHIHGPCRLGPIVQRLLARLGFGFFVDAIDSESVTRLCYQVVRRISDSVGAPMIPMSLYGNPEDVWVADDWSPWSRAHLQANALLVDAWPFLDLPEDGVWVELGPGLGRTVEILAQRYPLMTFLLFDLAPQLYVAHQYLSAVFSERVVSYLEIASWPGKILLLPAWRLPDWANVQQVDVFWNSASLQEMEPAHAANYLRLVQRMQPQTIYLNMRPEGKATERPVTAEWLLYRLAMTYRVTAEYQTDRLTSVSDYRSYVLTRQDG